MLLFLPLHASANEEPRNYIKFVTRRCWAPLGYCINIDAQPGISQCIYLLTTPDCLLARNMCAGLLNESLKLQEIGERWRILRAKSVGKGAQVGSEAVSVWILVCRTLWKKKLHLWVVRTLRKLQSVLIWSPAKPPLLTLFSVTCVHLQTSGRDR